MWLINVIDHLCRLSGYSPFAGDTDSETFTFINKVDYDFDDEAWENVSPDAKDFISKLLSKDKRLVDQGVGTGL